MQVRQCAEILCGFNTKKVRLKLLYEELDARVRREGFNTKKVRLKRHRPSSSLSYLLRFNTKKVRLKLVRMTVEKLFCIQFQYQKGAIKTGSHQAEGQAWTRVSIPKRCD